MVTDPYSIEGIGASQLLGTGSEQNMEDIMRALYGTLQTAGYFGTEAAEGGTDVSYMSKYLDPSAAYNTQYSWGEGSRGYDLAGLTSQMQADYGEGGHLRGQNLVDYWAAQSSSLDAGQSQQREQMRGMGNLADLFESLNLSGMQKEYGQDVGEVRSEIGAQMQGLQQGLTVGGKGSRYSGIGTPRRNLGGGRQQYMSDYYGLQQKQFDMERDMQKELEEQFSTQVGQYMNLNPYAGVDR